MSNINQELPTEIVFAKQAIEWFIMVTAPDLKEKTLMVFEMIDKGEPLEVIHKKLLGFILFDYSMHKGPVSFPFAEKSAETIGVTEQFIFYAKDWLEYPNRPKAENDSWYAQLEQAARKYVSEIRGGELTPSDKEYFREKAAYIAGAGWRPESEKERMIVLLEWMEKQFGISYIGRKSNSPEDVYKQFLQYQAEQKAKNKS